MIGYRGTRSSFYWLWRSICVAATTAVLLAGDSASAFEKGACDFGEGSGLFGKLSEEIKHLAVETYLDRFLSASRSELRIKAPVAFLQELYASKPAARPTPKKRSR